MHKRQDADCPWHASQEVEADLSALHNVLNCASLQGCSDCVPCSEQALDLFRQAARRSRAAHG
ncbi:MAG: hypothetical protein ACM31D_10560 [Bacteroidota bacterium]